MSQRRADVRVGGRGEPRKRRRVWAGARRRSSGGPRKPTRGAMSPSRAQPLGVVGAAPENTYRRRGGAPPRGAPGRRCRRARAGTPGASGRASPSGVVAGVLRTPSRAWRRSRRSSRIGRAGASGAHPRNRRGAQPGCTVAPTGVPGCGRARTTVTDPQDRCLRAMTNDGGFRVMTAVTTQTARGVPPPRRPSATSPAPSPTSSPAPCSSADHVARLPRAGHRPRRLALGRPRGRRAPDGGTRHRPARAAARGGASLE